MDAKERLSSIMETIIISYKDDIEGAMLFGSISNGTNDQYSDIDLLIVVKDEKTKNKLLEKTRTHLQTDDILILEKKEFSDALNSCDIFYKYEVFEKGKIIYERNNYFSSMELENNFDKENLLSIYKNRFENEINYIEICLDNAFDRLKWAYTNFFCMNLSRREIFPRGLEGLTDTLKNDPELSEYYKDFTELTELSKEIKHRKTEYPFKKLEKMYLKLNELRNYTNKDD